MPFVQNTPKQWESGKCEKFSKTMLISIVCVERMGGRKWERMGKMGVGLFSNSFKIRE
jgi:hypothetical protein